MTCRWSSDASDYLRDGEPCKRDDYGDPTNHCTARRTCANHIGPKEQTCARCVGRTRVDIKAVTDLAALMPIEALTGGVNSEAANLSGPAANTEAWSWRKIAAKQGGPWHLSLIEDDDDWHPFTITTRWHWLISADYHHDLPEVMTLAHSSAYLDAKLNKVAQDPDQDFAQMAREFRKCRNHLESVLRNSRASDRGAPCPSCGEEDKFVRLTRSYGHWCDDSECTQIHHADTGGDEWVCPRNSQHRWSHSAYAAYLEERNEPTAS